MKTSIKRVSVIPEADLPLTAVDIMRQMKENVERVANALKGLKKAFDISKDYAPPTSKQ